MSITPEQISAYISEPMSSEEIDQIIEQRTIPDPHGIGTGDARIEETGTRVVAVIAGLDAENGNINQAAKDFRCSTDAILADVFFYWRHKELFDAEILLRRSAFMEE